MMEGTTTRHTSTGHIPTEDDLSVPASSVRDLSRQWTGRLAHYRRHRNDEHLAALVEEAARYCGLHLENDLSISDYWSKAPLARRAAVLLYLVDREIVVRGLRQGRVVFVPTDEAEVWAKSQSNLSAYLSPTLELIAALRSDLARRSRRLSS
jgi:hypothetical protein